jgi:YrbI family 3-deoxy-D-manno-octulosonate 8-phosphate phosphatase
MWNRLKNSDFLKIKIFFTDIDGTFTDGFTYYSEKGEELKRFNHKDGAGVKLLRDHGIQFGIITTENSQIVKRRAEKLNADYCFIGVNNKVEVIGKFLVDNKLTFSEIAFIGDDINDLELLKKAGVSFAVNDAVDTIKKNVNIVCRKPGGFGAFREAVDIILYQLNS